MFGKWIHQKKLVCVFSHWKVDSSPWPFRAPTVLCILAMQTFSLIMITVHPSISKIQIEYNHFSFHIMYSVTWRATAGPLRTVISNVKVTWNNPISVYCSQFLQLYQICDLSSNAIRKDLASALSTVEGSCESFQPNTGDGYNNCTMLGSTKFQSVF